MSEKTCYLIGADLGTTAVKVGLFDDRGKAVAIDTVEHTLITPKAGVIEQSPEAYWNAFKRCLSNVLDVAGVDRCSILAMSLSVQGETLAFLDAHDKPLGNFIVWMDTRAQEEAEEINSWFSSDEILAHTGQGPVSSIYPAAKILWVQRHQHDVFSSARKVVLLEDWMFLKLVGKATGEGSLWCTSYLFDINTSTWWPEMLERMGLADDQLPEIVPSGTPLGTILPEVADELGLPHTLQLVQGGLDTSCGTIGVGNVRPGTFSESTGAVLVVCTKVDHPVLDKKGELPCFYGIVPGVYMLHTGAKGGIMYRWLRDQLFSEELAAEKSGGKAAYEVMDDMAAQVAPGAEGLVLLPNFGGAGAPDTDQWGKGLLYGLGIQHTKAHIARAFLEATAMNIRRMIDYTEEVTGSHVQEVISLGGASKSPLWCQIKADVLGRRVVTMHNTQDAAALGAALIAGVGIGIWPSLAEIAEGITKVDRIYEPDPATRDAYDRALDRYARLTNAIKPITKELY